MQKFSKNSSYKIIQYSDAEYPRLEYDVATNYELREYDELWVKEFEKNLDNKDSIEERTVWDSLK